MSVLKEGELKGCGLVHLLSVKGGRDHGHVERLN